MNSVIPNAYPRRWLHLQRGVSIEYAVRGLILEVANRLATECGVRANPYFPALDIDGVDLRLHLESRSGNWAIDIEVAVRSSVQPSIVLGRAEAYGTLRRWLARGSLRQTPCLLFHFDWRSSRLLILTPAEIRQASAGRPSQNIPLPDGSGDPQEALFALLANIASAETEADARQILI